MAAPHTVRKLGVSLYGATPASHKMTRALMTHRDAGRRGRVAQNDAGPHHTKRRGEVQAGRAEDVHRKGVTPTGQRARGPKAASQAGSPAFSTIALPIEKKRPKTPVIKLPHPPKWGTQNARNEKGGMSAYTRVARKDAGRRGARSRRGAHRTRAGAYTAKARRQRAHPHSAPNASVKENGSLQYPPKRKRKKRKKEIHLDIWKLRREALRYLRNHLLDERSLRGIVSVWWEKGGVKRRDLGRDVSKRGAGGERQGEGWGTRVKKVGIPHQGRQVGGTRTVRAHGVQGGQDEGPLQVKYRRLCEGGEQSVVGVGRVGAPKGDAAVGGADGDVMAACTLLMRPLLLSPSEEMAIGVEEPGGGVARARLISVAEEEDDPGRLNIIHGGREKRKRQVETRDETRSQRRAKRGQICRFWLCPPPSRPETKKSPRLMYGH
ncbi:hypothetical protein C8J57DRAFT_1634524 [Mycena rebaudengoi]|nr:hypothetical protein C8J57DRAFT_1634524 [Mycena rebaudengoi]